MSHGALPGRAGRLGPGRAGQTAAAQAFQGGEVTGLDAHASAWDANLPRLQNAGRRAQTQTVPPALSTSVLPQSRSGGSRVEPPHAAAQREGKTQPREKCLCFF